MNSKFQRPVIACSILDADHSNLKSEVESAVSAGVDMFTIDVMDGRLVPRITFGDYVVARVREWMDLPMEVHLMTVDPEIQVPLMADAGADMITFHVEATEQPLALIEAIQERGLLAGVAVNVDTSLDRIRPLLGTVDLVNLMAVPIGLGGQPLDVTVLDKVRAVRAEAAKLNPALLVEVDGGVKVGNIGDVAAAGADMIVVGTGIYHAPDRKAAVEQLRRSIVEASSGYDGRRLDALMTPRNLPATRSPETMARLRQLRDNLNVVSWEPAGPPG